ncbi:hypothetical protein OAB57_00320 [Bacteriovoracaceae bacterium]|nr:hypothetical protein [Bacteriovoracaceae bacterium]
MLFDKIIQLISLFTILMFTTSVVQGTKIEEKDLLLFTEKREIVCDEIIKKLEHLYVGKLKNESEKKTYEGPNS